jgi:hypothetical protein
VNDEGLGATVEPMSRHIFLNSEAHDGKVLAAARKAARSRAAAVLTSLADTMLLELALAQLTEVAQAPPELALFGLVIRARMPERKPLARSEARGALTAVTKVDQGWIRIGSAEDCTTLARIKPM